MKKTKNIFLILFVISLGYILLYNIYPLDYSENINYLKYDTIYHLTILPINFISVLYLSIQYNLNLIKFEKKAAS